MKILFKLTEKQRMLILKKICFLIFRSRGWVSVNSLDNSIEIAYKKVGDGHPLRLWRVTTEFEATVEEVWY